MFCVLRGTPLSYLVRPLLGLLAVVACALLLSLPAQGAVQTAPVSGPVLYLAQIDSASAARIVERQTGGKVLSVHRQETKGRIQYRVKVLLPEGRVRTVMVDAESGQTGG